MQFLDGVYGFGRPPALGTQLGFKNPVTGIKGFYFIMGHGWPTGLHHSVTTIRFFQVNCKSPPSVKLLEATLANGPMGKVSDFFLIVMLP